MGEISLFLDVWWFVWSKNLMSEAALIDRAPKSCKLQRETYKNDARGCHFGPVSATVPSDLGSLDHPGDTITVKVFFGR